MMIIEKQAIECAKAVWPRLDAVNVEKKTQSICLDFGPLDFI